MKNLTIFLSFVLTIGFTTASLAQDNFNILASVEHVQYREVAPTVIQKNAAYERDLAVWLGTKAVAQRDDTAYERDLAVWLGYRVDSGR